MARSLITTLCATLLLATAACTGSPDTSTATLRAPSDPQAVVVVTDTATPPAAPTNFVVVVDSINGNRAYITATWTDNSGGTAYTFLFNLYNGAPNHLATAQPGETVIHTQLSANRCQDLYLRTGRYINTIPGPIVYSAWVGPVNVCPRHA